MCVTHTTSQGHWLDVLDLTSECAQNTVEMWNKSKNTLTNDVDLYELRFLRATTDSLNAIKSAVLYLFSRYRSLFIVFRCFCVVSVRNSAAKVDSP